MIINLAGLLFLSCLETTDFIEVPENTVFFGETYLQSVEIKGDENGC